MSNDSFKFTPTGDFITAHTGDGVLTAASLKYATTETFSVARPKQYILTPQDDATPVEAMYVAYYFAWFQSPGFSPSEMFPQWQIIKRHFTEVK